VSASLEEFADEAEFAGYVDSGIWEMEEWLYVRQPKGIELLMAHLQLCGDEDFSSDEDD
jgi:hypothetical protein